MRPEMRRFVAISLFERFVEEVVQDLLLSRRQRRRASNRPPGRAGRPRLVDEAGEESPRNPESAGVNLPEDARQPLRGLRVGDEPFCAKTKKREGGGLRELLGQHNRSGRWIRGENLRDDRVRRRVVSVALDHVQNRLLRQTTSEG